MASVSTDPRGNRRVLFTAPDRRRRTLRLGKVPKKAADEVKGMVERLNAANLTGHAPDDHTARWVAGLDAALHGKLAAAGLVAPRDAATLGPFLDGYLASREADAKASTLDLLVRAADCLAEFLGRDRPLRDVTPGDADDYRRHLTARGLGENTVRRRVGRAKQFFHAAVRKRLVEHNPFADQKCQVRGNPERAFFLTAADAAKVLDACPDVQWRLIFALARWGGLRCPSELLPLTWGDVDWDGGRLRVTSPKTAHHEGGGERLVPLFPELRPHLEAAFDAAEPGAVHVITRCRDSRVNLRTQFQRIVRKAGLTPWPKLFQNLRATRETELAATFPIHVVCDWIGNSRAVAAEHYLQTTDADFARAAGVPTASEVIQPRGDAESDARPTQKPTLHTAASSGTKKQGSTQPPTPAGVVPPGAVPGVYMPSYITPRVGLEPTT